MIAKQNSRRWLGALRWSTAALAVAVAHGGGAWYAVHWRPAHAEAAAGAPEPAVMIELAPLSVAPEAPAEPLPPAPDLVEPEQPPPEPVKEPPPPEPEPEPPPPEPVVETPPVEPPPEPTPVEVPEPEIKIPDLPAIPDALAVLASPPKPVVKPPERKPPPKKKIVERKPVERPRPKPAAAPPPSPAPAAAPTQANQGVAAPSAASVSSWRGSLMAHLNRYKRFPGGASPGTVQVAFSIDRGGRVLSARLVRSSGDSALDEEAVSMIRRASPVPSPPAGVGGGGAISLAVPVRFSR